MEPEWNRGIMRVRVLYDAGKPEDLRRFLSSVEAGHEIVKLKPVARPTGKYRRVYIDIRPKK